MSTVNTVDKNQAVIDFLMGCDTIANNPLFFNFLNAKDNSKQIITEGNETLLNKKFIDGSVLKRYTFTIIDFRSVTYLPIPKTPQTTTTTEVPVNENVEELLDVQGIMDWINQQADAQNYPDFGNYCTIEDMRTTSENPNLNGIDTQVSPALAKYSISIQIDYIDTSKAIWNS